MNFLQIAQAVKRESGLSGELPSVTATTGDDRRIANWVNWAARDITLMREDWRFRRGSATLASTLSQSNPAASFSLTDFASWKPATRFYKPTSYRLADTASTEGALVWLDYDAFRATYFVGTQTPGRAQHWSVAPDESFLIGPTPDTEHFIRADYVKDYIDMSADADIPVIPTRFHMLIVWRALMEYGGFDAAGEVFQRAQANYLAMWPQLVQSQIETPGFAARSLA